MGPLEDDRIMFKHHAVALVVFAGTFASCQLANAQTNALPLPARQQPIAAEKNPPGDIPDNQAFVTFKSPLGFSIKVPEGWARRDLPDHVAFSDKYNALEVRLQPLAAAPSLASLQAGDVAALQRAPQAVRITSLKPIALPVGQAFVLLYSANSAPNPVTNKAIRLDNARYYLWKAGRLATLTVSAPAGADNADQWQLMARSFAWQ